MVYEVVDMAWTWKDELIEVLNELGGEAQLTDIYAKVEVRGRKKLTPNYQATIRGTLESYCPEKKFDSGIPLFTHRPGTGDKLGGERSGRYSLINYNPQNRSGSIQDKTNVDSSKRPFEKINNHEFFDINDQAAIEGYHSDRKNLDKVRNRKIVDKRKSLDNFTCQACGFRLMIKGRYVIECHHMISFSEKGERLTRLEDLVSLCPTCHRIVHTRTPPYSIEEVKALLREGRITT